MTSLSSLVRFRMGIAFTCFCATSLCILRPAASADTLYVTNYSNHTIEQFDASGNGTFFANTGMDPIGIAADSTGNLYVAEYGYGRVYKIDKFGTETLFATPSLGGGTYGLAIDSAGDVYASSNYYGDGTIDEYNSAGTLLNRVFGSSGTFAGPAGMAFDSGGNLFVAASTSNSIEEFKNGDLSNGTRFNVSGTLDNPDFLAFGSSGSETSDTPEPGSLALLSGLSFVGSGLLLRRRRK